MRSRSFAAAACAFILTASCGGAPPPEDASPRRHWTVRLEQGARAREFDVEVASTPETRATGLMGRTRLGPRAGMLFLFPGPPARRSFWMKDTLIPLDIVFARDGAVIEIREMEPCRSNPCPITTSSEPADSALEVAWGVLSGIGSGARLIVLGAPPEPR